MNAWRSRIERHGVEKRFDYSTNSWTRDGAMAAL
jgi:hypothetical protein